MVKQPKINPYQNKKSYLKICVGWDVGKPGKNFDLDWFHSSSPPACCITSQSTNSHESKQTNTAAQNNLSIAVLGKIKYFLWEAIKLKKWVFCWFFYPLPPPFLLTFLSVKKLFSDANLKFSLDDYNLKINRVLKVENKG